MAGHINFVENVYDKVKKPLGYICNKVKILSGNSNLLEDSKWLFNFIIHTIDKYSKTN